MTHEIMNALAARRRSLPDGDNSRYQTLKLVVQRSISGKATVSLVYTDVGGHRLQDTRLGVATIDTHDRNGDPLTSSRLMRAALDALHLE